MASPTDAALPTTACPCAGSCHHSESPCSLGCWAAQKPWRAEEAVAAERLRASGSPTDAVLDLMEASGGEPERYLAMAAEMEAADRAPRPEPLGVERLGLSDEQAAILRGHLASRQQTVSEFLGDVLMEMGLGRATGKEWPLPAAALAPSERADG